MIFLGTQEAFDEWISKMDEEIESLKETLPPELSTAMDYSVESLVAVEKHLLNRYSTMNELKEDQVNYERFSRYVGEVRIRHSTNRWCIELEDEEFAFFGTPVVGSPGLGRSSPFTLVTSCIDRQTGVFMEKVVKAGIKAVDKRNE